MTTQTIAIIVSIFIAWSGFLVGVIKYLLKHNTVDRSSQIEELKLNISNLNTEILKLHSELAKLHQEMPLCYVRKADFTRCQEQCNMNTVTLERKIDDLRETLYEKLDDLAKELRYAKTQ